MKSIADDKLVPSSLDLLLGETFWRLFLHNSVYSRLFSSRKYIQEGLSLNMGLYIQKSLDLDTIYLVTSAYTCRGVFWYHKRQYLVFLDMQAKMSLSIPAQSYVLSFVCLNKKGLRQGLRVSQQDLYCSRSLSIFNQENPNHNVLMTERSQD